MRTRLALVFMLMSMGLAWLALPYIWLPKGTSTISLWWAAATFHQCSRETPKTDGNYWLPTASDINELELGLPSMLELRDRRGQKIPPGFQQFQRQYIGFTRNGQRLIYGNFFSTHEDEPWKRWSFLEKPVVVCDGGTNFWGVVYDPKNKQFEEPQFNGEA
jgi:hypothetical protein